MHPSFLQSTYKLEGTDEVFNIRQVPGDGGCLFHALAVCLSYKKCRTHKDFDSVMRKISNNLREISVDFLLKDNETLVVENEKNSTTNELLEMTAEHYKTTPIAYCKNMRNKRTWGGGPEIVAICNYLQRPIYVYELGVKYFFKKCFELKISAKFGSPYYDTRSPIHILCADGRYNI